MDFHLVVTRGRTASQTLKLADGTTTVGRQEDCNLRIASAQVSRRHCQLFEHKGFLLVKDLGSSNGTYVNGKKVSEQRVLEPGDELSIGPVKFRVEKNAAKAPVKPSGDTAIVEAIDVDDPTTAPVDDVELLPDSDFEAAAIAIGDDDVFEVDFDEEDVAEPLDVPGAQVQAPSPPTKPTVAVQPQPAAPTPAANAPSASQEKDLGEDAVADFLMNLEIDEE